MLAYLDQSFRQRLIIKHKSDILAPYLPDRLPFSRNDLVSFLRSNAGYVEQFIRINPDISKLDDIWILEKRVKFLVYNVDRGKKTQICEFSDIYDAINCYFEKIGIGSLFESKKTADELQLSQVRAMTIDDLQ
jgi:hypothetical protein